MVRYPVGMDSRIVGKQREAVSNDKFLIPLRA